MLYSKNSTLYFVVNTDNGKIGFKTLNNRKPIKPYCKANGIKVINIDRPSDAPFEGVTYTDLTKV